MRKVKLMAVELDVPAVLLAQMNRDSDRRLAPYLPILSDLRNSGAIEQVADQVSSSTGPRIRHLVRQGYEGGPAGRGLPFGRQEP